MAANGYYDQDGQWIEPGDGAPAGRAQDPYAPGGYTVPKTNAGPAPAPAPGPDPTPPPTTTPAPTPTTPGGGFGQFNGHFSAPGWIDNPDAPQPDLPTWHGAPAFHFNAPTPESMKSNPAFQFRNTQGLDALQRWAASRGTLNDSGTANALVDYAGNSASQEYDSIYNRDWQTQRGEYDTNY